MMPILLAICVLGPLDEFSEKNNSKNLQIGLLFANPRYVLNLKGFLRRRLSKKKQKHCNKFENYLSRKQS